MRKLKKLLSHVPFPQLGLSTIPVSDRPYVSEMIPLKCGIVFPITVEGRISSRVYFCLQPGALSMGHLFYASLFRLVPKVTKPKKTINFLLLSLLHNFLSRWSLEKQCLSCLSQQATAVEYQAYLVQHLTYWILPLYRSILWYFYLPRH